MTLIEKIEALPIVMGIDYGKEMNLPSVSCVDRDAVLKIIRQHEQTQKHDTPPKGNTP
jgi:hypothetical protein